jgi:hypothetical protein
MSRFLRFAFCAAYAVIATSLVVDCQENIGGRIPIKSSTTIPPEKWQKFTSEVAGFSILMPGEVRESIGGPRSDTAYADVRSCSAEVELDAGSFAVAEHVYTEPIDQANQVVRNLDHFQEVAARNLAGKIVSQRDVPLQGMPARRVSITSLIPGLTYTMDELFILKGNRLFRLSAMGRATALPSEDIDRFFNSFNITGPAKEWKRSRSDPNEIVEKDDPEPAQITTGVTSFECPTYPPLAKQNHIGGIVTIRATTNGKKIIELKTSGFPLLAQAAEANVRTWKFADNAPTTFTVTYVYVQEGEYEPDPVYNCRAKLELPNKVEVSANW